MALPQASVAERSLRSRLKLNQEVSVARSRFPSSDTVELAQRHVSEGRRIVDRQKQLIAKLSAPHLDTADAENLLTQFIATQKIFALNAQ